MALRTSTLVLTAAQAHVPSNTPPEFDRQQTFRDALSLDANGLMVIDRIAVIDPLPGGTTRRLEVPTSGTCRYRKVH